MTHPNDQKMFRRARSQFFSCAEAHELGHLWAKSVLPCLNTVKSYTKLAKQDDPNMIPTGEEKLKDVDMLMMMLTSSKSPSRRPRSSLLILASLIMLLLQLLLRPTMPSLQSPRSPSRRQRCPSKFAAAASKTAPAAAVEAAPVAAAAKVEGEEEEEDFHQDLTRVYWGHWWYQGQWWCHPQIRVDKARKPTNG